jgi:hypothetical protein
MVHPIVIMVTRGLLMENFGKEKKIQIIFHEIFCAYATAFRSQLSVCTLPAL